MSTAPRLFVNGYDVGGVNYSESPIPRMKNHGTLTSLAEVEAFLNAHEVSSGKFTDLQVGDYITLAGYTCYIAGFDTEYNKGDSTVLTDHHISFVADFGGSKMNSSNTTSGGYESASVMQSFLTTKAGEIANIASTHLKTRNCCTSNSTSGGKSSGWGWNDHKLTLLTETQVTGAVQWGNAYDTGEGNSILPIFEYFNPIALFGRKHMWLRGVYSSETFCAVRQMGILNNGYASSELAAVALFVIG